MILKTNNIFSDLLIFFMFLNAATASTCNVILMRNNELYEGIEIFDKSEQTVGTSKVAAKKASDLFMI